MTEQRAESTGRSSPMSLAERARRTAQGAQRRFEKAMSTVPRLDRGSVVVKEQPVMESQPRQLTYERIILGVRERLDGEVQLARNDIDNAQSELVHRAAKRTLIVLAAQTKEQKKVLEQWQAYCDNERIRAEMDAGLRANQEAADQISKQWVPVQDVLENKVRASGEERLAARIKNEQLLPEVERIVSEREALIERKKHIHESDGDVLVRLTEAREIKEGKKKAPRPPANKMAGIVYDAEQELIEHILSGGLKAELEAAVEQERNAPPPLPQRTEATSAVRPAARPTTSSAGPQERRAVPAASVRHSVPTAGEVDLGIPPFIPSRHEGAAQYAVSQLLAGVRPVTVENPGIPLLLREAKVVLARMSAGIFTDYDLRVILTNRIFGDPRFSDVLRSDLVASWAQGTEVFGKNRLTKVLGMVMYLMGGIGDIQTPDVFKKNRFLRPIRKLMDLLGDKGISPDDFKHPTARRQTSASPAVPVASQRGRPAQSPPPTRQEQRPLLPGSMSYAIELIGKVASGAPLTGVEGNYLDTDRTFLSDPVLQRAYMRAVSMRQIRSGIATSQTLTPDDMRFLEQDRQLLQDPIFKAAYDAARRRGIRAAR